MIRQRFTLEKYDWLVWVYYAVHGYYVDEVLERLKEMGVSISDKTLYNWETGIRKPDADQFVMLCQVYGVKSFKEFESNTKEKAPTPEGAGAKEHILLDETNELLVDLGYIQKGQQLSDADFAFLEHIVGLMRAWFGRKSS